MFAVPSESFGYGFYICMEKDDALVLVDLQFWCLDSSGELVPYTEQTTLMTVPDGGGDSEDGQFDNFNEIMATLTESHDVAVTMSGNIKDLVVPVRVASLASRCLPISLQLKKNTRKHLLKLSLLVLLRIYQVSSRDHPTVKKSFPLCEGPIKIHKVLHWVTYVLGELDGREKGIFNKSGIQRYCQRIEEDYY
jgi:hypothetical protein